MLNAIKLYSTSPPLDREVLVLSILKSMQDSFGALPVEFDIHGPYGIKKGSTVGFKAFQKKLEQKGHDGYYALSGNTSDQFGFHLLLGARIGETSYSEIIVWYAPERFQVDFLSLSEPLLGPLNACCGFEIEIPADHMVTTETRIRQSILGSISVDVSSKHLEWIQFIGRGDIRGPFRKTIVNGDQLKSILAHTDATWKPTAHGLHYVHQPHAENRA